MAPKPWTEYKKAEEYCRRDSKCKFIYDQTGSGEEFFICRDGTTLADAGGKITTVYGKGNNNITTITFHNS